MMKAILSSGTFKNNENKNINGNMKNEDTILSSRIQNEISNLNLNLNSNSNSNQLIENKKVSIIFCHADIQGASMNDNMRCKEGLDISAFPPNLPIYSGHFHKPHTVRISTFFHFESFSTFHMKFILLYQYPIFAFFHYSFPIY